MSSPYDSVILADTPISYWSLADASGTTAADTGDSNPGTYNGGFTLGGAAPVANMDGSTAFNGSTGYVNVPNATNLNPTTAISIEGWIYFNSVSSTTHLLAKGLSSFSSPWDSYSLSFNYPTSGKLAFSLDLGGTSVNAVSALSPTTGVWYYVAGTWDGANANLYINGSLQATTAASGTITYPGTPQPLSIGRYNRGGTVGEYLNGSIAAPAVYNYALTQGQVYNHWLAAGNPNYAIASARPLPLQPRLNARWSRGLARAQCFDRYGSLVFPDLASYAAYPPGSGTVAWTQDQFGSAIFPNDSTGQFGVNLGNPIAGAATEFTLMALATATTSTGGNSGLRHLWSGEGSSTDMRLALQNGLLFFQIGTDGTYTNLNVNPPPLNVPVVITARLTTAGVRSIWYGPYKVAERTDSGIAYGTAGNSLGLGSSVTINTRNWSGPINAGYVFTRALSDAEIVALAADPFAPASPSRQSPGLVRSAQHAVWPASTSDSATFTGTGSAAALASGSISASATFTGLASASVVIPVSISVSATFSDLAGHVLIGTEFAQASATFSDIATHNTKFVASASSSATFNGVAGRVLPGITSDTATFTEFARGKNNRVSGVASDSAIFTETPAVRNVTPPVIWHENNTDTATFTDLAIARSAKVGVSASDSASFGTLNQFGVIGPDIAGAVRNGTSTASDTARFTDIAYAVQALPAAASSSATFTDLAKSNHFWTASAHDTATFTGVATEIKVGPNAHDSATFTDAAYAQDLLKCGLVVPGGDQQATLRQVLYPSVSAEFPVSFCESAEGLVLIANGVDPVIAWDAVSATAWTAGLVAPSTVVWLDGSGAGLLTGRRYAFVRWVDVRGNTSNLSPWSDHVDLGHDGFVENVTYDSSDVVTIWSRNHRLATGNTVVIQGIDALDPGGVPIVNGTWAITVVDQDSFTLNVLRLNAGHYKSGGVWTFGAASIQYSSVPVPTDPKVVRRQILRNLEGNANVFYVDIDTTDLTSTTFSSTMTDEQLAVNDAVPLQFDDKEPASQRYYPPPSHKKAVAAYAGRIWATADLIYSIGNVQVSLGSPVVVGIGTSWTANMAGRLLYVAGAPAQPILAVSTSSQMLVLETPFRGQSNTIAFYSIRPAPIERRLVYFSEPNLPEAWPPWNAFALPESSDEIVGIFVLRSFLYILKERNIYKFSYREEPAKDGYVFPVAARGCVNDRCYAQVNGVYYIMDENGVYSFNGDTVDPISDEQSIFIPDGSSTYQVDWEADRTLWNCVHDPMRGRILWFVDFVNIPHLTMAIVLSYSDGRWWLERYPEAVSSSALVVVSGYRQSVLGTTARRVYCLGQGTLDGVPEDVTGTLRGTATAADSLGLTDTTASFPSNLAGVPVTLVSGTGAGQQAIISTNTANVLTLVDPWQGVPDRTTVYQVGGIPWTWKSGWRRISDDESENPRDLEFVFKPTSHPSSINARVYYDHSSEPSEWAYTIERDGISITEGDDSMVIDLSTPRGYAIQRMSGHRDPYGYGHRYCALELDGVQGLDPQRVFQLVINGAE